MPRAITIIGWNSTASAVDEKFYRGRYKELNIIQSSKQSY